MWTLYWNMFMTGHPMKICCFHIVCECDMEKEHISVFIVARNASSFFVCVYHILLWIILDISKTERSTVSILQQFTSRRYIFREEEETKSHTKIND